LRCDGTPFGYATFGPYSGTGCGATTYKLGAALPARTRVYSNAADSCADQGTAVGPVYPLQKVSPDTFVEMQDVSRPGTAHMNAWVREGADGSSEVIGFYDQARQAPCFGLGAGVSSDACVPRSVDITDTADTFADSACTQRVGFDYQVVCGPPETKAFLQLATQGDECQTTRTIGGLWEAGSAHRGAIFYSNSLDGTCTRSAQDDITSYLQGAPISVASLPKLEVMQVGTGSLRVPFYGYEGVPFYPVPNLGAPLAGVGGQVPFIEAATGNSCNPYLFADGTWRCIPSTFQRVSDYDSYYQSPDCTGALVYPWASSAICSGVPRQPLGIFVLHFGGCGDPVPVTETLTFEEPSLASGLVYHPSPTKACEPGFSLDDRVRGLRATKPVNPADLFIPFERILLD